MISIDYISSRRKITLSGPESFDEMTTEQYQNMVRDWDGEDIIKLFCILFGADYETTLNSPYDIEGAIAAAVAFVYRDGLKLYELPVPEKFLGAEVPKDLGGLSLGQAIILRNRGEGKKEGEMISMAVAIYMQPIIDGKHDSKRVEQLEREIAAMPVTQTFALGFFFASTVNRLWADARKALEPAQDVRGGEHDKVAEASGVKNLNRWSDHSIIETYCAHFPAVDPDAAMLKSFDNVMTWMIKWKEEREVDIRAQRIKQAMK